MDSRIRRALFISLIYYLWAHYLKDVEFDRSYGAEYLFRLLSGNERRVWSRLRMTSSMIIELAMH